MQCDVLSIRRHLQKVGVGIVVHKIGKSESAGKTDGGKVQTRAENNVEWVGGHVPEASRGGDGPRGCQTYNRSRKA